MPKPTDQMQAILDAHAEMNPLPIENLSAELARQMPLPDRAAFYAYGHHITKRLAPMPLSVGKVEHKTIPAKYGQILTRIYTPKGTRPKEGWPVLVYFHGGGWVIASLDTYDSSCRALCDGAECIVVSVHYRQAPEHKWPAAHEDAFTAYTWVCANAAQFGGNTSRVAVAGESAGGNLAAVLTLTMKDKGENLPLHQLLIYPVTDLAHGPTSASAHEHVNAKPLNTPMLHWFYNHYLPVDADRTNPHISPLHADLTGLPPATVILAEIDPLRSEGISYAAKLEQSGVKVNMKTYKGVTHEFFGMAGLVEEAGDAVELACRDLRKAFGDQSIFGKVHSSAGVE